MTNDRIMADFAERLDALGADISRWPAAPAAEAQALLARSPEARERHGDARKLSDLVERAARAATPNGFAFRVVADVAARRNDRLRWLVGSPARLGLVSAGFCVAALALGVTIGAVMAPAQAGPQDLDLGAAFGLSIMDGDL